LDLTGVALGDGGRAEVFIITVTLLYLFLGLSSLAGLFLMLVTMPLNSFLQKKIKKYQALMLVR
jgi:hypothetical protein